MRVVVSPSEKRFAVRTPPPPPEGEWALDVLELKGDRAFNMALNMASPHERLLVDGDAMAKRVVFGGAAERTAFAANGDKHYKRRNACSAGFFDGTEKRGGAPTAKRGSSPTPTSASCASCARASCATRRRRPTRRRRRRRARAG